MSADSGAMTFHLAAGSTLNVYSSVDSSLKEPKVFQGDSTTTLVLPKGQEFTISADGVVAAKGQETAKDDGEKSEKVKTVHQIQSNDGKKGKCHAERSCSSLDRCKVKTQIKNRLDPVPIQRKAEQS